VGKGGRYVGADNLTTFMCTDCLEIWELQPAGTLRSLQGCNLDCFSFFTCYKVSFVMQIVFTARYEPKLQSSLFLIRSAMSLAVIRRYFYAIFLFRSQTRTCEIFARQNGARTGISPSSSVFPMSVSFHQCSILIFIYISVSQTFFQVGTSFISQNVLRTTLLLGLSNSLGLP